ncbi:MAG TPA: translation elongation factor Ts [Balneolaceae bacterium]|nr:translation elongation factor Ts [Balneolaceae bacterium]
MSISAQDVKQLREKTGAGIMDCKQALQEADGSFEEAKEILRKKGQKLSEKRADRQANQGLIVTKVSEDGKKAAALEINCETDFVARNDDFQQRAAQFLKLVFDEEIETVDKLLATKLNDLTVADHLKDMVGKIGEKIEINKIFLVKTEGEVVSYVHPGNQLAVLVEFEDEVPDENVANNIAMQVAAMNPIAVNREGVDESVIEKELEIAKEQLRNQGKPEQIVEKAAKGKLGRFYEDHVLLEQKFVKDNSISVKEYLKQNDAPLVTSFNRIQLGEEE